MKVRNKEAFVVTIAGKIVIPPLAVRDVPEKSKGVDVLIKRGVLEQVGESEAGDEPRTVAELKEALTAMGVEYPDDAKKPDLQALYDAGK